MTKTDFSELLKKYNIDENLVVFDDSIKEGYCVRKNYFRWEVFFRERGKEHNCVGFPSESNALQYLFDKLYSIYVKDTKKESSSPDRIPDVYCAVALSFPERTDMKAVFEALEQIGICDFKMKTPKCSSDIWLDIAVVNYEPFWHIDEALTKMFSQIDGKLSSLAEIAEKFDASIYISISYCEYGTNPSVTISGENMKKIRLLKVSGISVDPY